MPDAAALRIEVCQPARHSEGVAALIVPIQQQEFGIAISREQQPDLADIHGFYQQGKGNFWVAIARDAVSGQESVVGSIGLLDIGNGEAALRKMFVQQAYRGKREDMPAGVAAELLATLIRFAREQALTRIYLGTTSAFLAAHRFYEKHGFTAIAPSALPERFPVMQVDTCFYALALAPSAH